MVIKNIHEATKTRQIDSSVPISLDSLPRVSSIELAGLFWGATLGACKDNQTAEIIAQHVWTDSQVIPHEDLSGLASSIMSHIMPYLQRFAFSYLILEGNYSFKMEGPEGQKRYQTKLDVSASITPLPFEDINC